MLSKRSKEEDAAPLLPEIGTGSLKRARFRIPKPEDARSGTLSKTPPSQVQPVQNEPRGLSPVKTHASKDTTSVVQQPKRLDTAFEPAKQAKPAQQATTAPFPDTLPLTGIVLCFAGEFNAASREEFETRAKWAGARVGAALASNTSFLVLGSRPEADGQRPEETTKHRRYLDLKARGWKHPPLLSEADLLAKFPLLVSEPNGQQQKFSANQEGEIAKTGRLMDKPNDPLRLMSSEKLSAACEPLQNAQAPSATRQQEQHQRQPQDDEIAKTGRLVDKTNDHPRVMSSEKLSAACEPLPCAQVYKTQAPSATRQQDQRWQPHELQQHKPQPREQQQRATNWVDAHAPRDLSQLIGNGPTANRLAMWLQNWQNTLASQGDARKSSSRYGGFFDNSSAKAVLVSGPPGIGKTTTCRIIAQQHCGYEVLEYNASDARGQKAIQEMADGIADNTTINFGQSGALAGLTRRACIIMDEVDGMGAGDRGGNAALIKMIKKTRNPIICICNDQSSQKIRSLASHCFDLKFSRPQTALVAQRCAQIADREGLKIAQASLMTLAESCGGDMRMALNQLQALARSPAAREGRCIVDADFKQGFAKDGSLMMTPFDACRRLINTSEASHLSIRERLDMFFIDFSLVGLLVQENYLRAVERRCDLDALNRCAYSADLMTMGDMMNQKCVTNQDWSLLPDIGLASAAYPTFITHGSMQSPSFPAYLGKYSHISKMRRFSTELQAHLRLTSTVSSKDLLSSGYADLLYMRLMQPLLQGGNEAASKTAAVLDTYGLRKEHLSEHLSELRQHTGGQDLFKSIDSKVKAGLTRELNSGSHACKIMLPTSKRRRAVAGGGGPDGFEDDEQDDEVPMDAQDGSDNDMAGNALIKQKSKAKSKTKAKAENRDSTSTKPKARAKGKSKQVP